MSYAGRIAYLVLGAALAAGLMFVFQPADRDAAADQAAIDALRRAGWKPAEVSSSPPARLDTPDELPAEVDEIAVLGFGVPFEGGDGPLTFVIRDGGAGPPGAATDDGPTGPDRPVLVLAPPPNWILRPGDLGVGSDSRVRLVRVDDQPLAAVTLTLMARTPSGIVRRTVEAEDVQVDAWIAREAVAAKRASLDVGFGVTTDADLMLIASWRRPDRRFGWFAGYQHALDAGGDELLAGVTIHIGRK